MTSEPYVLRAAEGPVATLTLNRAGTFNALSQDMMAALQDELDAAGADASVRAVIIRAEGQGFCAGHDLKEIQAHRNDSGGGKAFYEALFAQCRKLMETINSLPMPVIAEVQGVAAAAGCQLVATCDMAVASTEARFAVNGIDVGFFCSTPMVAVTRNIGMKRTFELLTTGRLMPALEAAEAGLVNRVVTPSDLRATTSTLAARIAEKPSAVIKLGKDAFYRQAEMDRAEAYDLTTPVMVENLSMPESDEGMAAFIEKRKPRWEQ